jgi:hypothetical protein
LQIGSHLKQFENSQKGLEFEPELECQWKMNQKYMRELGLRELEQELELGHK